MAPQARIAVVPYMAAFAHVATLSPAPTPIAFSPISSASVPFATLMQWETPQYVANASSKRVTWGPST